MTYAAVLIAMGMTLLMAAAPAEAPGKGIVGTWRLISMTTVDGATGKEADLWGRGPVGFLTYTPGGRMSAVITAAGRKAPAKGSDGATPEEQAALFRSCIAYAGTYTVTESGVVHHVQVSTDPTWAGTDQVRFTRLEGDRLTITGPPVATVDGPGSKVLKLVWERVE
jgi:hypothetical protein